MKKVEQIIAIRKNKMVIIVDDFAGEGAIMKFNNEVKTRSLDEMEVFVL